MISAAFLGHQSWLIEGSAGRCLVDPVVTRTFGNSPELQFEIWPPREVDLARMPRIDAVAFTNEHLDHFHLASLMLLRAHTRLALVPPLFPGVATDVLVSLGYEIRRLKAEETVVGGLAIRALIPPVQNLPVWESRCVPLFFRDVGGGTVLIQSDTALPEDSELTPDIFVATNNSQRRPPGWEGAGLTNLLAGPEPDLDLLLTLGMRSTGQLRACRWVTFSGSGYRSIPRRHQPFRLADSRDVARVLNASSVESRFAGLAPGDRLATDGTVDRNEFVVESSPLIPESDRYRPPSPPDWSFSPLFGTNDAEADRVLVKQGLRSLERLLTASKFGTHLVDLNRRRDLPVPSDRRFVIQARHDDGADVYTFDIGENQFRLIEEHRSLQSLVIECPTGMSLWLGDLARVFGGEVQIWEVCSTACIQWYVEDAFLSPASFFYEALAEPVQPELTARVYQNALSKASGAV